MNESVNKNLRVKIVLVDGTQCRFAHRIGVDEGFVSKVVNGYKNLSSEKKREWAKALNCKVRDIFPS